MTDFVIKEGDLKPPLEAVLERDGVAMDLTNTTVYFVMGSTQDLPKVDSQAEIVDASAGKVRYNWASGDTDEPDAYLCEFIVEDSNGNETTFPSDGYFTATVKPEVQRA